MSKAYYSYIRVSTVKQGQTGTSLVEQREAIHRYADRWHLQIVREFEEQETAAKSGRPVFLQMLGALQQRKAAGVIIHKIDRSARNLRDWVELAEIIDRGIEVHFANENVDLESRGGRLSADIQAVVAADYIRNLREEVRKGFYGRIKQGFYPMPAPTGYIDKGGGELKERDPIQAPLVRKAFQMYATGQYGLHELANKMFALGLRNKGGGKITLSGMSKLLHNHFYTGLIRIKRASEMFPGRHRPIVSTELFDRVQLVLRNKKIKTVRRHELVFRRLIQCGGCGGTLIGEMQKGHVYYRCHKRQCEEKGVREEIVEGAIKRILERVKFTELENRYLRTVIRKQYDSMEASREDQRKLLNLQFEQLRNRLSKLTDAYIDGIVDQQIYGEKKNSLVIDEQELREKLSKLEAHSTHLTERVEKILELANQAYLSYELGNASEKRKLVQIVTSNLSVKEKKVSTELNFAFQLIVKRQGFPYGRPHRGTSRTLSALVSQLLSYFRSRKDQDEEEAINQEPVRITPRRLRLAFRGASSVGPEKLAA